MPVLCVGDNLFLQGFTHGLGALLQIVLQPLHTQADFYYFGGCLMLEFDIWDFWAAELQEPHPPDDL